MLGACDLAQLRRHFEYGSFGVRLIGRKSLFFGLAFGADRRLKCEARAMLSGNVFNRSTTRPRGWLQLWLRLRA